jgi:tRNA A37 threonylcarbamoyladenosine synthetase subunit TsaC/SUA5/YrdC
MVSRKREHSRKPDELYEIIESCSPGPYLELFARTRRDGWLSWGNEVEAARMPKHRGYAHNGREVRTAVNNPAPVRATAARIAQGSDHWTPTLVYASR